VRKSAREKLADVKKTQAPQLETDFNGFMKLLLDPSRPPNERRANPTQLEFIIAPERVCAYMGPAGVAKTSTLACMGMMRALFEPGSKGLVGRRDYNDLMGTTFTRFQEMLNALPKEVLLDRDKSPPLKWYLQPIPWLSPEGDVIDDTPSEITFSGLTDSLGSFEYDWIAIDEADQIDVKRAREALSRLRWISPLNKKLNRQPRFKLAFVFNPPDKHHWLYEGCTGLDFQNRPVKEGKWIDRVFRPKPNENERNLPAGYHEELAKKLSADQKQRLVDGEWGATFEGQPVFREFDKKLHGRQNLRDTWTPNSTLLRFWDFGYRHPACIWAYVDFFGRLIVMKEALGENIEATEWIQRCKSITNSNFPGVRNVLDYGDPAVVQKKDTGQTLAVLHSAGINMLYMASTIEHGVMLLRQMLNRWIDKEPAFQLDVDECPMLTSGLEGGYRLDEMGIKPVKDGFYDHLCDALRYGVVNLFTGTMVGASAGDVSPGSTKAVEQWSNLIPDNISPQD
jgi:hypothetical protein